jgi:hypothetical protein
MLVQEYQCAPEGAILFLETTEFICKPVQDLCGIGEYRFQFRLSRLSDLIAHLFCDTRKLPACPLGVKFFYIHTLSKSEPLEEHIKKPGIILPMALTAAQRKLHRAKMGNLWRDLVIIALGIFITLLLVQMGALGHILAATEEQAYIGSFISGIFFTSIFTIAPASIALGVLSHYEPAHIVALWGALGAMMGDLFLFLFIRDVFADDVDGISIVRKWKKVIARPHFGLTRILMPVLGALLIASPLPDEIGLAILGFSRTKTLYMLPITFAMNFLGIYAIALIAAHVA